jgi:hypothetical protein
VNRSRAFLQMSSPDSISKRPAEQFLEPLSRGELAAAKGIELLDTLADVAPMVLFKSRVDGPVHHWTMELPTPK